MSLSRICRIVLALVVALSLSAAVPLWARTKTLPPNLFKPVLYESDYRFAQSPMALYSAAAVPQFFWATVKLPVGQKIRALKGFIYGTSSGSSVKVELRRVKVGQLSTLLGTLTVAGITGGVQSYSVPLAGDLVVQGGYQYYVSVQSDDQFSMFCGAKLTYR